MKIASIGCGFAGLVVGAALGWGLASHRAPAQAGAAPLLPPVAAVPGQTAMNSDTKAEARHEEVGLEQTVQRLEVLRWLTANEQRRQALLLRVFDWNLHEEQKLDPTFVAVFGLNPEEVARLEAAAAKVRRELELQMAAAAQVKVREEANCLSVVIPPLPQEGGRSYDQLFREFTATLGPARAAYLGPVAGDSFDDAFRAFGAGERRFDLERVTRADGEVRLVVKEESTVPGENRQWISHHELMISNFATEFPVLAKVVPADFTQATAQH